ncbi:CDK inhibitor P21 binding protein, putative [Ixodes scapularis]|uniref:Protein BCCIP homolog n=1 Tax=Ixodes scapularis TaxID=6945 RepID=B7QCU0_IXOSC|nr:CDK inhibitor P21 binding protein, putative [Ixodes scapularis]|eukprot:XP_002413354.1 CDK inhibitor P21 binding protein, putative [Ixodes scapularis]
MAMSKRRKQLSNEEESEGSDHSNNNSDSEEDEFIDTEVNVDFELALRTTRTSTASSAHAAVVPQARVNFTISHSSWSKLRVELNVDFEARTPDDSDFHGIKRLMQQLFLKARVNLTDLTNLILEQNFVSSVIKQCDDEMEDEEESMEDTEDGVFGVMSVVNVTEMKQRECVGQIVSMLRDHCRTSASGLLSKFDEYFAADKCQLGLILSERFVNIPPRIAVPLYDSLTRDVESAKGAGKKFDFSHLLLICKQYRPSENEQGAIFANAEEELFEEEAELQFEYSVTTETDTAVAGDWKEDDAEMTQIRKILVIPTSKWGRIMDKLKSALQ